MEGVEYTPEYIVGFVCEACDEFDVWYKAKVVKVRTEGGVRAVKMHFYG